ncbi:MAG: 2-dehydro-3-deoxy-6-phosphogalactonate aldolase [Caulobacterales bacterium]
MTLDEALAVCPAVAILRGVSPDEAVGVGEALFDAGVRAVEVPLNSPDPLQSLRRLASAFAGRMICGAGTVLTPEQVYAAAEAGGRFIVAPNTESPVIRRSVALGLEPVPGFATASEAFTAIAAGARRLKLFPASTYGPGHLRQLGAVLPPDVQIWAVGGVRAGDLAAWWAAGARAFGIGSEIYCAGQTADETRVKARIVVAATRALAA